MYTVLQVNQTSAPVTYIESMGPLAKLSNSPSLCHTRIFLIKIPPWLLPGPPLLLIPRDVTHSSSSRVISKDSSSELMWFVLCAISGPRVNTAHSEQQLQLFSVVLQVLVKWEKLFTLTDAINKSLRISALHRDEWDAGERDRHVNP